MSPAIHDELARLELTRGNNETALHHSCIAAELDPTRVSSALLKAQALAANGRHDDASKLLEHVLDALSITEADDWITLGNLAEIFERDTLVSEAWSQARTANPHLVEFTYQEGCVFFQSHRYIEAAQRFRICTRLDPTDRRSVNSLLASLVQIPPSKFDQLLKKEITRCLSIPSIDPHHLRPVAAMMCLQDEALCEFSAKEGDPSISGESLRRLQSKMLVALIESAVNTSPELERILQALRRLLIRSISNGRLRGLDYESGGGLLGALAQQCFLNEYVFIETAEETECLETLVVQLSESARKSTPVDPAALSIVAAYRPLYALPNVELIRGCCAISENHYAFKVVRQQILDLDRQRALASNIESITPVKDDTSVAVRRMYEENPYPRWTRLDHHAPTSVREYIREKVPLDKWSESAGHPSSTRVLVVGAGTGKQALSAAMRFLDSQVIALDLSKASLAYGAKIASELGITNIKFVQGDLLELPSDYGEFDVVECVGVMHHLSQPDVGWDRILETLRPGGYARIGLYSRRARRLLDGAREFAASNGWQGNTSDIRQFRQAILARPLADPLSFLRSAADFYCVSECRDLIFHVMEHSYDLVEVSELLQRQGLRFLGFEHPNEKVFDVYRTRYPDDPNALNLSNWDRLEEQYPDIFATMYQFWAIKQETI